MPRLLPLLPPAMTGPGIYDDALASVVHDSYLDLVGHVGGRSATDRVLDYVRLYLADPDQAAVVWLALAATQWRLGRLEGRARDQALAPIRDGTMMERWRDRGGLFATHVAEREAVLRKWERRLSEPMLRTLSRRLRLALLPTKPHPSRRTPTA